MTSGRLTLGFVALLFALGCSEDVQLDDGGTDPSRDGGNDDGSNGDAVEGDASGSDAAELDGAVPSDAAGSDAVATDGATIDGSAPRGPVSCQGRVYACGDTLDNDGDGLADDRDPDCLGPCDNNEEGLFLNIPGGDSAPCKLDCYFDGDQGSGNDSCEWDHRCDPLEPDPVCDFSDPPPPSAMCPDVQEDTCQEVCAPLVPNGCDCFGCCNLPSGGDRWVFIGSVDEEGEPTCTLDAAGDDEACHQCTPVDNCLNTCGECELCLGRTELPPSCFPAPMDGGVADAGSPDGDGGVPPGPTCDDGRQLCGIPGVADCPPGDFCLTGCCTIFE